MSDDQKFDKADAGSSDCTPISAGDVKKGGYCMLKGFPCKVTQYSTAKPGKHGSAKATIVGVDIFTNKKYQDTAPTSAGMQQPIVTKVQYQIVDIDDDDFVTYDKGDGSTDNTIKLPKDDQDIYNDLTKCWEQGKDSGEVWFSLQSACGKSKWVSGRKK